MVLKFADRHRRGKVKNSLKGQISLFPFTLVRAAVLFSALPQLGVSRKTPLAFPFLSLGMKFIPDACRVLTLPKTSSDAK